MRVPFDEVVAVLARVLRTAGMDDDRATRCARLFAEASRDGVASHGLNRFPRFRRMIARGVVDLHATPERVSGTGSFERWEGRRGVGNLNAVDSMNRAIALSRTHGMGCIALANTNHWMRGGAYGWQAADAGAIAICWTNTLANMPPWGASEPRLGNNPLVIAVPRTRGHVVLDMAMSQFSVGALIAHARRQEPLPIEGGFDTEGRATRDARAILDSARLLPIGAWKGSGLSLMLDLLAAALSGGHATREIPRDPEEETGLSQVFIAFDPAAIGSATDIDRLADAVVDYVTTGARRAEETDAAQERDRAQVRYPGAHVLAERERSLREGVLVIEEVWDEIRGM
ncbi:MAG TPA: 3-dehydro-L-gulonate 2-dehydrogenase [Vicinamibacterales bacterium]